VSLMSPENLRENKTKSQELVKNINQKEKNHKKEYVLHFSQLKTHLLSHFTKQTKIKNGILLKKINVISFALFLFGLIKTLSHLVLFRKAFAITFLIYRRENPYD